MKKKILSLIIISVLIIAQFMPIVMATNTNENLQITSNNVENEFNTEEDNTEKEEKENKSNEQEQNDSKDATQNSIENDKLQEESNEDESLNQKETETNGEDEILTPKTKSVEKTEQKLDTANETETKIEENEEIDEEFSISVNVDNNKINSYLKNNINYLFIPKSADLSKLDIDYTGNIESINNANFDKTTKKITGTFENESEFTITLKDGQTKRVKIMQSDVPAIYVNNLTNKDTKESKTLQDVNSGSKATKYNASLTASGCDQEGNNISKAQEIEFKGRGNTSWKMPKRSYQIKLNKKTNFLGIGESKEKKWVLIANYQDPTLLKNKIMNDLCVQSGLASCPNCSFADLYVDGNYVGNYLVCDKVEINNNRVKLKDPKGLIVELDNAYYDEEEYKFESRGNHYVVKEAKSEDDDATIKSAVNSFKAALDAFETELYSSNPSWEKISQMIDIDSFAKYYIVNEFAENTDSYYSSCYLYKDGDSDIIHMGPTWDYDAGFGFSSGVDRGEDPKTDFTLKYAFPNYMQRLYTFPQFATKVNEIYEKNVRPVLNTINVNEMSSKIQKSAKINSIVWSDTSKYSSLKNKLNTFVEKRKSYYSERYSSSSIEYSTHVERMDWLQSTNSGKSGTEGQSLRVEGLRVDIGSGYGENISVQYKTHVENIGWQDWVRDGQLAGTTGQSLRLEAVQLKLNNTSKYSIRYRVHIQDIGWQEWKYDGETAGTEGQSLRLEAIEIQIVPKRYNLGSIIRKTDSLINYKGHIENIGDTGYGTDGDTIGTIGLGLRLEGLKIELGESLPEGISLEINEHIQDIGWVYGLTDKDYIGTKGESRRIEALTLKLKGEGSENYTIQYRTHVQNIGWQDWVSDGKMAGTTGQSLRIEAIEIMIQAK